MEFFTVPCPGRGEVCIDGRYQGENKESDGQSGDPNVFQCGTGLHDISMKCLGARKCQKPLQRVSIEGTNPILPMEVAFTCAP